MFCCTTCFQCFLYCVLHCFSKLALCFAMLYYDMLCYTMLCYSILYYAMQCYAILCCAMRCYAMLCYAMLCYAIRCHAMLYYAMLGYAMQSKIVPKSIPKRSKIGPETISWIRPTMHPCRRYKFSPPFLSVGSAQQCTHAVGTNLALRLYRLGSPNNAPMPSIQI